jgi:hypothetical protein
MIGLINRMRLFAPPEVVGGAEAVLRAIVEILLKPSIELRQLAKEALAQSLDPDPLLMFSQTCRADLEQRAPHSRLGRDARRVSNTWETIDRLRDEIATAAAILFVAAGSRRRYSHGCGRRQEAEAGCTARDGSRHSAPFCYAVRTQELPSPE